MTKAIRILRFIHKFASKMDIDYHEAEQYYIVQEYIRYVERDTEIIG